MSVIRAEGSTTGITGSLGGGKTLHGVELMMERIALGGVVSTNVPLYPDKIGKWLRGEYGLKLDEKRIRLLGNASIRDFHSFAVRGGSRVGAMMVLDEAALDLNAHDHRSLARETFNFVVLCRKMGIDLIIITQDAGDVDVQIRKKFQKEIHCRCLKKFLSAGGLLPELPIFVRVTYVLELGKKPMRQGAKFAFGSPAFGMYDTHALHGSKALEFSKLEMATDEPLERIKYPVWPYAVAGGLGTVASAVSTSLCL